MKYVIFFPLLLTVLLAFSCGNGNTFLTSTSSSNFCYGYTEYETSSYILPYEATQSYTVTQGNCGTFTHTGNSRYAYDFSMNIGTSIRAARAGTVIEIQETYTDGNGGTDANYVLIQHDDLSIAVYAHLTFMGVSVNLNESVSQGATIGQSGNTGFSTGPHLHFEVLTSNRSLSIPVTFRDSGVVRLKENSAYVAASP